MRNSTGIHLAWSSYLILRLGDAGLLVAILILKDASGTLGISPALEAGVVLGATLTGLIVAATLVMPSKKIADLTVENVLNRFKENSFARGANREIIKECEALLNLPLDKFIRIVLRAMQEIGDDLGL